MLSVADNYDDWQRANRAALELDATARLRYLSRSYQRDFGNLARVDFLRKSTVDEVRLVYRASAGMTLTTHDEKKLDDASRAFDELAARQALSDFERATQYRLLVALRHFDAAAAFARSNPSQRFESLPAIDDSRGCCTDSRPQLLFIDSSQRLQRRSAPAASIVVVAHPLCHFTQNAIHDIEKDAALASALEKSWLWIAPQDGYLSLDAFETWNSEHPHARMSIAYRQSEWPMAAIWDTPTFYFFRNGAIVASVHGWPAEGHLAELRDDAKKIGLAIP